MCIYFNLWTIYISGLPLFFGASTSKRSLIYNNCRPMIAQPWNKRPRVNEICRNVNWIYYLDFVFFSPGRILRISIPMSWATRPNLSHIEGTGLFLAYR